jgi:hypothetical protein
MKKLIVFALTIILLTGSCRGNQGGSTKIQTPTVDVTALEQELAQTKDDLTKAHDIIARQQANLDEFALQVTNAAEQRDAAYNTIRNLQRRYDSLLAKQNPWPGLNIYADPTRTINVKAGEEFVIWYDLDNEMFIVSLDEFHDDTFIKSVAKIGAYSGTDDQNVHGVGWFLFRAVKAGNTQITVQHTGHLMYGVEDVETFNVVITD